MGKIYDRFKNKRKTNNIVSKPISVKIKPINAVEDIEGEYITGVAIKHNDTVYSLSKPNRHHDVRQILISKDIDPFNIPTISEGFTTNKREFVGRREAAEIAYNSRQVIEYISSLTSDDVW